MSNSQFPYEKGQPEIPGGTGSGEPSASIQNENPRLRILDMIERGKISAEEGLRLLAGLEEVEPEGEPGQEEVLEGALPSETPRADLPGLERWRHFWMIPVWIGAGLIVLAAWWMYRSLEAAGFGLWFVCAGFLLLFGVLVVAISAPSSTTRWLHLRVHQAPGEHPQKIAFSFPLPLGIIAWLLSLFKGRIPNLQGVPVDDFVRAVGQSATPENPLYIKVDEGEHGERVEIYIG